MRAFRLGRAGAVAAILLSGSGCMFWVVSTEIRAGELLPPDAVKEIGAGTPAHVVLDRLGPPTAVARPGERVLIPLFPGRRAGSRELSANELFGRFRSRQPPGASDVVYYYEAIEFRRPGRYVALLLGNSGGAVGARALPDRLRIERLLLLVDGERRIVRDVVLEEERIPPSKAPPKGDESGEGAT